MVASPWNRPIDSDRMIPGPRASPWITASQVSLCVLLLSLWVMIGTIGYLLIEEGWSVLDAFYMTIITITTVGYREVHPLSSGGQLFTSLVVVVGLGLLLYTLARVAQAVIEGELLAVLGRRRMMAEIAALENHVVVCGFGKVGRPVAEGLAREGVPFCVVERNPDLAATLQAHGYLHVLGDATEDGTLRDAGVERARTLLALLASDADNLYLTIAARELRNGIRIIARASDEAGELRLKRAGADDVVSPARIAGLRVLQAAVNPAAVEFMEIVTQREALQLSLADIPVAHGSILDGTTIAEAGIRGRYGVIVVAIKQPGGGMKFNPGPDERIEADDMLVVMGEDLDMAELQDDCARAG
jgi:voltage-gated potassium channel